MIKNVKFPTSFYCRLKNPDYRNILKTIYGHFLKVLIILIFPLILFAQDNYEFGPSIMVNDDTPGIHWQSTTQRSIACRGDTVYLVWRDDRFGNPLWANSRVFFSKSTDAGSSWSSNIIISQDDDTLWGFMPHLAIDALGKIYVVYNLVNDVTSNMDICFTKSTNGGDSFSPPIMVNDSADVIGQRNCAIAVDSSGNNVYVAWQDSRNYDTNGYDIYFSRSTDGGMSFLPSIRVNDDVDSMDQWRPVVTCDETGQYVYMAWMDNRDTLHGWDVYFSRSTDYGQTFEVNYLISDTTTTGGTLQGYPSIYYKNGVIYLVWRDQCNGYCVTFSKSTDNGVSFGPQVLVPDNSEAHGSYPSISADDSANVYIVWTDTRAYVTYGYEIYFAYSSDKGQSFNQNVLVNDHLGVVDALDDNAAICVNENGKVFVAWDSDRNDEPYGNPDIYFARGTYVGIEEYSDIDLSPISLYCYPNPFSNRITIKFQITNDKLQMNAQDQMTIKIYNSVGRLVKVLGCQSIRESGHQVMWDGMDEQGESVSSGIYFIELVRGEEKYVKKIVKIE